MAELETALIELPLGEIPEVGYVANFVQLRLNEKQARTMKRIFAGLTNAGAQLDDGQWVKRPVDVIRYILDRAGLPSEG